jgi:hypothetical protein
MNFSDNEFIDLNATHEGFVHITKIREILTEAIIPLMKKI